MSKCNLTWLTSTKLIVLNSFVASVYRAKATRSTLLTCGKVEYDTVDFDKVDRVEFDFVASVYWSLRSLIMEETVRHYTQSSTCHSLGS